MNFKTKDVTLILFYERNV